MTKTAQEKIYKCPRCDARFEIYGHRNKHIRKTKDSLNIYVCKLCPFKSCTMNGRAIHAQDEHNYNEKQCDLCPFKSNGSNATGNVQRHKRSVHFECQIDYKTFDSLKALYDHTDANHPDKATLKCEICENVFATKNSYKKHLKLRDTARNKIYHCKFENCSFKSCFETGVNGHIGKAHNLWKEYDTKRDNNNQHICRGCDYKSKSKRDLAEHSVTQHNECIECENFFPSKLTLYQHQRVAHPDSIKDMIVKKCLELSCDFIGPLKTFNRHSKRAHKRCKMKRLRFLTKHFDKNPDMKIQTSNGKNANNYFPEPKRGKWVVMLKRL